MIRDNVADGLADLCAALGLLENFRTDIGKPHIPRRPLEQPDAQLILGSVTRRLTIEIGILGRFAASEKLLVSTTLANIASELRSIIVCSYVVGNRRLCRSSEILRPDSARRVTGKELS